MPSVDEILVSPPLAGLRRVSHGGGDRKVVAVRLAEQFAELDDAPAGSFVVLGRLASAEITDYRLDMALRWAAIHRVAAVAAFSARQWQPAVTALDITGRRHRADVHSRGRRPRRAGPGDLRGDRRRRRARLGRAREGLEAVRRAERAGAVPEELGAAGRALGTRSNTARPRGAACADRRRPGRRRRPRGPLGVSVPVLTDEAPSGHFASPEAGGEIGVAASLVLHAAAAAAARPLDLARRARDAGPVAQRAARRTADVGLSDQRGPARPGAAAGHPGRAAGTWRSGWRPTTSTRPSRTRCGGSSCWNRRARPRSRRWPRPVRPGTCPGSRGPSS